MFEFQDEQNVAVQLPTGVVSHSKSDHLGRKVFDELQLGKGLMNRTFTYHKGEVTQAHLDNDKVVSNPETALVKQIEFADGRTIQYEYDAEERITKVTDSVDGTTVYTYDSLGQLLTEKKNGTTINEMVYAPEDDPKKQYGNILKKNGVDYTYDTTWKDKLIKVGTQSITYDAQGNPTSYLGHTLTWEKGRQLKSYDTNTYKYNKDGIRISKTVNGVEHKYVLDGTNIVKETWGSNTLIPLYDLDGTVCGINYNGTAYYFYRNLQGDVVAITTDTGITVANYSYDVWGKCTITSDTSGADIAVINPYRYRSYYYDIEIGMYYLQSRYYDPESGRFVNSDLIQMIILSLKNVETNTFAYCENNCVNRVDSEGYKPNTFFAGFGFQIEIGASLGIFSGTVGVEFVWYTSNLVSGKKGWPIAYWYYSFAVGYSVQNMIDSYIDKLLKNPKTVFSTRISISASVCAFAIWGYKKNKNGKKKFSSPSDYLGPFTAKGATIYHVKGYVAQSQTCFAVGAGYDVSRWGASFSKSNYKYCDFLNKRIFAINVLYNFIFNMAKNLK